MAVALVVAAGPPGALAGQGVDAPEPAAVAGADSVARVFWEAFVARDTAALERMTGLPVRSMGDRAAPSIDSLRVGDPEAAGDSVLVPTVLVGTGKGGAPRFEFLTVLRAMDGGWRIQPFSTIANFSRAGLASTARQLERLNRALEKATRGDSARGDSAGLDGGGRDRGGRDGGGR